MGGLGGDQELGVLAPGVHGIGVTTDPDRSRGSSSGAKQVISLVLSSTRVWASTALACWSAAVSR